MTGLAVATCLLLTIGNTYMMMNNYLDYVKDNNEEKTLVTTSYAKSNNAEEIIDYASYDEVNINTLLSDLSDNEYLLNEYKGKTLKITGMVSGIKYDTLKELYYITVATDDCSYEIKSYIKQEDWTLLGSLEMWDTVELVGLGSVNNVEDYCSKLMLKGARFADRVR